FMYGPSGGPAMPEFVKIVISSQEPARVADLFAQSLSRAYPARCSREVAEISERRSDHPALAAGSPLPASCRRARRAVRTDRAARTDAHLDNSNVKRYCFSCDLQLRRPRYRAPVSP